MFKNQEIIWKNSLQVELCNLLKLIAAQKYIYKWNLRRGKKIDSSRAEAYLRRIASFGFHSQKLIEGVDVIARGRYKSQMQWVSRCCLKMIIKLLKQTVKFFCRILQWWQIQIQSQKLERKKKGLYQKTRIPDKNQLFQLIPCCKRQRRMDGDGDRCSEKP